MYEHRGVGLAANQVNLPFRLFVANEMGNPDEGEELVFINPVISRGKGIDESEEGCLSIPGVNRQVKRNKSIHVNAYSLDGKEINQTVEGFLAKIIQHETITWMVSSLSIGLEMAYCGRLKPNCPISK